MQEGTVGCRYQIVGIGTDIGSNVKLIFSGVIQTSMEDCSYKSTTQEHRQGVNLFVLSHPPMYLFVQPSVLIKLNVCLVENQHESWDIFLSEG